MEQKLAIANCIALQYNDSRLNAQNDHNNLINKTLQLIVLPDLLADGDERASLAGLKHLIKSIADGDLSFDIKTILHRLRIICASDLNLMNSIKTILEEDQRAIQEEEERTDDKGEKCGDIEKVIRSNVNGYVEQLRLFNNGTVIRKVISKASYNLNSSDGNLRDIVSELQEELGKYNTTNTANGEREGFVERVTTKDKSAFKDLFDNTKEMLSGSVLKTGWNGINRMMGVNGGMVPGELWVMPALPHNAKTTFSLSMLTSFAIFNDPEQFVAKGTQWEGKTPMILDISLENSLDVNIPIAYKMVREHFEKVAVDIRNVDSGEASEYIVDKLSEKGWFVSFERYNSSQFTIETLRDIINTYEAEGYRIVACRVDYLGVSNKAGLSNGVAGSEVREMYRRARNIASPKKIALISPHQLSPAAKALRAMDEKKYVRELVGKGYYDGCTTVDNEVDGELFFGITEQNGFSYLEVQRGKHRTIIDTPIKDRYRVIKFAEIGTLPWDVDTDIDTTLKSVNADAVEEEESFLEF